MKAVRASSGGVQVVEVAEPEGPGELIRISAVSICASDWNYIRRGSTQILGHEISGVTASGTPVVVEGSTPCGACEWCAQGRSNRCHRIGTDILGLTVPGAMSEYFRAPTTSLVPLPSGLRPEDASLAEPGAVAWHAVRSGSVTPDTRVAVVGAGAIGLIAVLAAREQGAPEVALEARHSHQIEIGDELGATRPTREFDVVIEATGGESGLHRAVELSRPGGTVVGIGVYPPDSAWPWRAAFLKEVRVVPSLGYDRTDGGQVARAAALLARHPALVDRLLTHRFGIDEAPRAFEVAAAKDKGAFRVVVHP